MGLADFWVDDSRHLLHLGGRAYPCDREIIAAMPWQDYVLLLSSDTDCLSLWDADGLIRLTRVGVYPQDMALHGGTAYVCGGADGMLHLLSLPELIKTTEYPLPGMPERLCLTDDAAYILTLLTEPEVHTGLLTVDLHSGAWQELMKLHGIPEKLSADAAGLLVEVSEGTLLLRWAEAGT